MTDVFQVNWKPLSSQEYLDAARKATDLIWLGRSAYVPIPGVPIILQVATDQDLIDLFNLLDIKTRRYEINQSYDEWKEFSNSCFTVWYKNNKGWKDVGAQNYMLSELVSEKIPKNDSDFMRTRDFENDIIVTAYDTKKDKRLIIDGIHRAAILTSETEKQCSMPSARIYECYGDNVDKIFPCDFSHL
jgi:hypothetical protein